MIAAEQKNDDKEDICLLIRFPNHRWNYLCDCGTASRLSRRDCINTKAIFISHTHIDHWINFDTILRHQLESGQTVTVCGPQPIARQLQARLKSYSWNLIRQDSLKYEIRQIMSENKIEQYELKPPYWKLKKIEEFESPVLYKNDTFSVRYTLLDHMLPCIAYLFQENDKIKIKETPYPQGKWISQLKQAFRTNNDQQIIKIDETRGPALLAGQLFPYLYLQKGYGLGVVMDHVASDINHKKIITLFKNCDHLLIECFYKQNDWQLALDNYHSTARQSGKVARLAGVKKVTPIHFSKRYSIQEINALKKECQNEYQSQLFI